MRVLILILLHTLAFIALEGSKIILPKDLHFFYYIWYGNPDFDSDWKHWNHAVLPHWRPEVNANFPTIGVKHNPPHELHSPFYPSKGPYSSRNPYTLATHFREMNEAGGQTAVISWWGQASKDFATDTQGVCTDKIIDEILTVADTYEQIRIVFHLEPYPSRSVESVSEDIRYILDRYGNHSSLYRDSSSRRVLFYLYDSYHISSSEWARLLQPDGDISIRHTQYDSIFIGLWLDHHHGDDLVAGGFDGSYTYFATDGFSYGSTSSNWNRMCEYMHGHDKLCILSVGPGYDDTGIRPWNNRRK